MASRPLFGSGIRPSFNAYISSCSNALSSRSLGIQQIPICSHLPVILTHYTLLPSCWTWIPTETQQQDAYKSRLWQAPLVNRRRQSENSFFSMTETLCRLGDFVIRKFRFVPDGSSVLLMDKTLFGLISIS